MNGNEGARRIHRQGETVQVQTVSPFELPAGNYVVVSAMGSGKTALVAAIRQKLEMEDARRQELAKGRRPDDAAAPEIIDPDFHTPRNRSERRRDARRKRLS